MRILFICSANLCRSVTAAEFARRAALKSTHGAIGWQFASAGVDVMPGQRLPPTIETTMRALGIPVHHRPRRVDEATVRAADLVLTAERRHRAVLTERFPFAVRSSYTLLQFERLVEAGRPLADDHTDLVRLARIGQANVQAVDDSSIDIPDPVASNTEAAMLECAEVIRTAIHRIVR